MHPSRAERVEEAGRNNCERVHGLAAAVLSRVRRPWSGCNVPGFLRLLPSGAPPRMLEWGPGQGRQSLHCSGKQSGSIVEKACPEQHTGSSRTYGRGRPATRLYNTPKVETSMFVFPNSPQGCFRNPVGELALSFDAAALPGSEAPTTSTAQPFANGKREPARSQTSPPGPKRKP